MNSYMDRLKPDPIPEGDAMDMFLVENPDKEYYRKVYRWALLCLPSDHILTAIAAQRIRFVPLPDKSKAILWNALKFHLEAWMTPTVEKNVIFSCDLSNYYVTALGSAPYLGKLDALDWFESLPPDCQNHSAFHSQIKAEWFNDNELAAYYEYFEEMCFSVKNLTDWIIPLASLADRNSLETVCYFIAKAWIRDYHIEAAAARMALRLLKKEFEPLLDLYLARGFAAQGSDYETFKARLHG